MHEIAVSAEEAGARLDRFLASQEPIGTRARAERLIDEGSVLVDGRQRPKSYRLAAGATVRFAQPEHPTSELEPAAIDLPVPYEDEWLLVVDKPAGLLVHPVPGYNGPTLVHGLLGRARGGDRLRPGIVHRLDRDTSGLLVVARDERTLRRLQGQLRRRAITRRYLALVRGRPPSRRGTIEAPIGRDRRDPTRVSIDSVAARPAVTHFTLTEALQRHCLLDVELETGRTHQIRVHLAAIGHPVVADAVYGTGPELGLERQFLHAAQLRFAHPATGDQIDVASALPPDLEAALARARKA